MALGDLGLMTTEETAEYLRLTPGRVRQLARAGILPGMHAGGRAWVFTREEVERYARNPVPRGRPRKQPPAE